MPTPILKLRDLAIGYKSTRIAENINASIQTGQFICLIGPNGVGKSTLLRTIAGMQKPLSGEVRLHDKNLHRLSAQELAQYLSIVLTEKISIGLLTGYALVALGRHPYTNWSGKLSEYDQKVVMWAVKAVGAESLAQRDISELSDGERQKLMIARALAQEPDIMLLDEPTAYLDLPHRVEIMQLLRNLAHTTNRSVLLSTHDLDLALRTADQIWLFDATVGLQIGTPEDLILNRSFEQTFQSENVTFDRQTGSFQMHHTIVQSVNLEGDSLEIKWTKRALERNGISINPDAPITITYQGSRWCIQTATHDYQADSIENILQTLLEIANSAP